MLGQEKPMPKFIIPPHTALNTERGSIKRICYSTDMSRLAVIFTDPEQRDHFSALAHSPTIGSINIGDEYLLSVSGVDNVHALLETLIKEHAITWSLANGMNERETAPLPQKLDMKGTPIGQQNAPMIRGIKAPFSHVILAHDSSRITAVFNSVGQGTPARKARNQALAEMRNKCSGIACGADHTKLWITARSPDEIATLLEILQREGYIASTPTIEPHFIRSKEGQTLETFSVTFPPSNTPDAPAVAHLTFRGDASTYNVIGAFTALHEKIQESAGVLDMTCSLSHDLRSINVAMPRPERNVVDLAWILSGMGGILSKEGHDNLLAFIQPQIKPSSHIVRPTGLAAALSTSVQHAI